MCVNVCLEVWGAWRGDTRGIVSVRKKNRTKIEQRRKKRGLKSHGRKCMEITMYDSDSEKGVCLCVLCVGLSPTLTIKKETTVQRKANRIIPQCYIMWQPLSSFTHIHMQSDTTHKSCDVWDAADGWMLSAKCFPISHWEINKWMGCGVWTVLQTLSWNTFCLCGLTWSQLATWISVQN